MERNAPLRETHDASVSCVSDRHTIAGSTVHETERRRLFDEVFLPHLAQAFRLARWLAGNNADAEDIVQEASLRAFRGIHGFGGINAKAWALTVTRNTAYSWLTKNRPRCGYFRRGSRPSGSSAARATARKRFKHRDPRNDYAFARRCRCRPGRDCGTSGSVPEIIVLRELQDLNYREIAEITNVPLGTVMSRLARARQMLLHALGSLP